MTLTEQQEMFIEQALESFRNGEPEEAELFIKAAHRLLPPETVKSPEQASTPRPQFICAAEVLTQTVEIKKLIGRLIERGTTGQLFGPSGDGKTFVVLDMCLCVGTGSMWNSIFCEEGIVLYFAGEGHTGLRRRVKAWHRHHEETNLSNVHISQSVITFDAAGLRKVVAEAKTLEEQTGKKVALLVIDTLARHLLGDENSTRDMSDFVRAVDGLRDNFPESTAIHLSVWLGHLRCTSNRFPPSCRFESFYLSSTLIFMSFQLLLPFRCQVKKHVS